MRKWLLASIIISLFTASVVNADTFGTGENQFEIEFVTISHSSNPPTGWGIVCKDYRMGVYEITNTQWNKFTNIYGMPTGDPWYAYSIDASFGGDNIPANCISWLEALQFINWLNVSTGHQPAYRFVGTQGQSDYAFTLWDVADEGYDPNNPYRNSKALYFLPTEDEWVKAAYWNGTALQTYATIDDSIPTPGVDSNYAHAIGQPWDIGSGNEELNGTFDMIGNVRELTESPYSQGDYTTDSKHSSRGCSYYATLSELAPYGRSPDDFYFEYGAVGFRVASNIPVNRRPIANAGEDQIAFASPNGFSSFQLNGTDSYDLDGDTLEYYWYNDANELIATGSKPNVLLPIGEHAITLIVNDGTDDSQPDEVMITVIQFNRPPIGDAGTDQTILAWIDGIAEVQLDGTASYDPDGDVLEYYWYTDANELIAAGPEPNILFGIGEYNITLIVNDGTEDSEPDTCVVAVLPAIETQVSTRPGVVSMQKLSIDMLIKMKLPSDTAAFDLEIPMTLDPWGIEAYDQTLITHGKNNLIYAYFTLDSSLEFTGDTMDIAAVGQLQSGEYIYGSDTIKIH